MRSSRNKAAGAAGRGPVAPAPAPRRGRRRPLPSARLALAAAALASLLLLAACGTDASGDAAAPQGGATAAGTPTAASEVERIVRVVEVTEGELRATRRSSVSVRPSRESRVASGASGRVLEVLVREGAIVEAGEPMIRLDAEALRRAVENAELALAQARINLQRARAQAADGAAQAQAGLRAAEGNLAVIQRQLDEAEALLELGAVASADVQALRAQRDQAHSAALQAADALARAGRVEGEDIALLELQERQAEVQLRQAREALEEAVIRAPFAGEVAQLLVEAGEFVGAGSPVARLLGLEAQLASFTVPPEDVAAIEVAGSVAIEHGAASLAATVTRIERSAQQARLATVIATLDAGAPRLPSGSVAEVRYDVLLGSGPVLPSSALSAEAGRTYVFQVGERDGATVAQRTEVRVVAESGNQAVVAGVPAEALPFGAQVIAPRPLDVRDGTRVRIAEVTGQP
jgi:HlyD family secretion protein